MAPLSLAGAEDTFRSMLDIDRGQIVQRLRGQRGEGERFSGLEQSLLNMLLSEDPMRALSDLAPADQEDRDFARLLRQVEAPAYSVASAVASLNQKLADLSG